MHPLNWLDNRTLLACQCLLATSFACVLFGFRFAYPSLRGTRTLAIAFLLGIPGIVLIAMRGHIPFFLSVVVSNLLLYAAFLLLYLGVLLFFQDMRYFTFALIVVLIASSLHLYYALIDERIVPRILIASFTMGILGLLKCWTLIVHAERRTHRILFAISLFLAGCISIARGILTLLHGAPKDYMQQNPVQTYALLLGVLYIALQGIFNLSLFYFDLTSTLENKGHRDSLTGVLNRRGIEQKLSEEIARSQRAGTPVALLLIDLDFFKPINDLQGHAAGDEALRLVARSIASVLRVYDTLGRFGGDEFLLILPETDGAPAMIIAERIREALHAMCTTTRTTPLTLSIGVTWFERNEDPVDIVARADAALYLSKHAGRNRASLQPAPLSENIPGDSPEPAPRTTLLSRVTSRRRAR